MKSLFRRYDVEWERTKKHLGDLGLRWADEWRLYQQLCEAIVVATLEPSDLSDMEALLDDVLGAAGSKRESMQTHIDELRRLGERYNDR